MCSLLEAAVMKDVEKNRLGEMLSRAQQALAAKPNDQAVISGLATVLMQLGRLDEAEEHFRKSMSMDGSHIGTLVNYAILLDQRGKSDDACHLFKKALEINPTNPSALSSYAHILCKLGDYLRAENLLKNSIKRCPTDVTLLNNYGCLLWEGRKDYTRAEEILKKVVKLDPCHQASTQALEELREARARAEEEAAYHAKTLLAELAGIDGSRDQRSKGERPGAAAGPARTNCVPVKNRARTKKKGMKSGEDVAGEQEGGAAEETDALRALRALGGAAKNEPHSDIQLNEANVPGHGCVVHVDGQAQQASNAHASTMQGNGAAAVEQPQQKSTSPPRSPAAFTDDRARCRYADCRSCVSGTQFTCFTNKFTNTDTAFAIRVSPFAYAVSTMPLIFLFYFYFYHFFPISILRRLGNAISGSRRSDSRRRRRRRRCGGVSGGFGGRQQMAKLCALALPADCGRTKFCRHFCVPEREWQNSCK
jgi:Flp pilus assembly protein TadD